MNDDHLKELQAIKNLLVIQLLRDNVKSATIAHILKIDPADFSRAYPKKLLK